MRPPETHAKSLLADTPAPRSKTKADFFSHTTSDGIDLPGVDPKDVSVQAEGNVLTISGERKSEDTSAEYRETFYSKFERALTLPQGVETDKIAAHYQNGVLQVRVPLPAQLAGRKIPIQIEQKENKKLESKAA